MWDKMLFLEELFLDSKKILCFQLDYQFIKMVFGSLQTTFSCCAGLFFSSIALVPFGFIGGEFAKSDSGEFLVQINCQKDALEQSNFMAQRQKLLNTKNNEKSITR
jgi:HAE1 family hydrophobic/amphiphilic exporter-1